MMLLTFHDKKNVTEITVEKEQGEWLIETLEKISITSNNKMTFYQLKSDYETNLDDFEMFWYSKSINSLREIGLLVL
jgi:hypothetical protein